MRILTITIFILITTAGHGTVALLPSIATNNLTAYITTTETVAARRDISFVNGRVDRLENEVNKLEAGFVGLAVLFSSVLFSVLLLTMRDGFRRKFTTKFKPPQMASRPTDKSSYAP